MTKGVETYVAERLEEIEEQIRELRHLVSSSKKQRRKASELWGILKGVRFTEADIEEAKRSISKIARD